VGDERRRDLARHAVPTYSLKSDTLAPRAALMARNASGPNAETHPSASVAIAVGSSR
jgi:hypothetical protein